MLALGWGLMIAMTLGACGGRRVETFTQSHVWAGDGPLTFPLDFRGPGTIDTSLTWTVTSPGTGRFGENKPLIGMSISIDGCGSCDLGSSTGPSDVSPLILSTNVDKTNRRYEVRVANYRDCGGCTVQLTLTAMH